MIMININHESYNYKVYNISVSQCDYNCYLSTIHDECILIQFQVIKFKQKYIRVLKYLGISFPRQGIFFVINVIYDFGKLLPTSFNLEIKYWSGLYDKVYSTL